MTNTAEHFTGQSGEEFTTWFCQQSMIADYVFPNPMYMRGCNEKELCDVLIVFGDTVIIIQVKTAETLRRDPTTDPKKILRWLKKKIVDANRQIAGAKRAMTNGTFTECTNERRGTVAIPQNAKFYGIAVVDQPEWPRHERETAPDPELPTIQISFQQLSDLMRELSTAGDLIYYLEWRRKVYGRVMFDGATELDLMAHVVQHYDEQQKMESAAVIVIRGGVWAKYEHSPHRRARDRTDGASVLIDRMADDLHKMLPLEDGVLTQSQNGLDYSKGLDVLASLTRYERKLLGETLFKKSRLHIQTGIPRVYVHKSRDLPVLAFVVSDGGRDERCQVLAMLAEIASLDFEDEQIVAFALNSENSKMFSVDMTILEPGHSSQLSASRQAELKRIRKTLLGSKTHTTSGQWEGLEPRAPSTKANTPRGSKAERKNNKRRFKKRK